MESYTFWTMRLKGISRIKEEYQAHKQLITPLTDKCAEFSGEDFSEKDFDELYNHVCEAEQLIKRLLVAALKR